MCVCVCVCARVCVRPVNAAAASPHCVHTERQSEQEEAKLSYTAALREHAGTLMDLHMCVCVCVCVCVRWGWRANRCVFRPLWAVWRFLIDQSSSRCVCVWVSLCTNHNGGLEWLCYAVQNYRSQQTQHSVRNEVQRQEVPPFSYRSQSSSWCAMWLTDNFHWSSILIWYVTSLNIKSYWIPSVLFFFFFFFFLYCYRFINMIN